MLQNLVEQFKTKMDETFGGQMTGLNTLLTDSVVVMREMQTQFGALVTNLQKAGQDTSEKMGSRLTEMLEKADARQHALEARMGQFLDEIRKNMGDTQAETQQRLNTMVETLQGQTQKLIESFESQRVTSMQEEQGRADKLSGQTKELVGGLKLGVDDLVAEVNKAIGTMSGSISQMKDGAETLYLASSEFKDAGKAITGAMQAGQTTMGSLQTASEQVRQAAASLGGLLTDYQQARVAITQMTNALQELIEVAKGEAGVNKRLVDDMRKAADVFTRVGQQTDEYLGKVSEVLKISFENFGENVKRSLNESNATFHGGVVNAVDILSRVAQDLEVFMEEKQ